jgi:hypothetical protein
MRGELLRYMEANPVAGVAHVRSPFFLIQNLRSKRMFPLFIGAGLLAGGTLSFAAENTVPGNVLYPIKIHVNETVRGALAVTPQSKAAWEVDLVERRLEETEKLATGPAVPVKIKERAQENLLVYTDRVKERIVKFEDQDDKEDALLTAKNLSDIFRRHENVLGADTLQKSKAQASTTLSVMQITTLEPSLEGRDERALLEVVGALRSNAEGKQKELEQKYNSSQEFKKDKSLERSGLQSDDKKNKKTKDAQQNNGPFIKFGSDTVIPAMHTNQQRGADSEASRADLSGNGNRRSFTDMYEEIRATRGDGGASTTIEHTGETESVKNIEIQKGNELE